MNIPHPQKKTGRAGFTLIELLVSMVITVLIVAILITITGVASDTWARSSAEVRAARQAKVFIDTMAKDFESLVSRRGNNFEWLNAEIEAATLPTVALSQAGTSRAASLTFLTAATDRYLGQIGGPNDRGGDISCVSYRLRFQDPIDGGTPQDTSTFVLYRLLVNPDQTFEHLLGQENLKTAFDANFNETQVTGRQNFICENVHQFTLTFLVEVLQQVDGQPAGTMSPRTVRVTLSSDTPGAQFSIRGTGLTSANVTLPGITPDQLRAGRLRAVEMSISVLSDAAIVRRSAGDGLSDEDYARHSFHYSRVVEVPGL